MPTDRRTTVSRWWLGSGAACFVLWGTTFALALAGPAAIVTIGFRTLATIVLMAAVIVVLRRGPRTLLVSPALLMAALAIFLYGWAPAIAASIPETRGLGKRYDWMILYVGGHAELLVLGIGFLCLGVFGLIAAFVDERRTSTAAGSLGPSLTATSVAAIALLAAAFSATAISDRLRSWTSHGVGLEMIRDAVPWMSLAICALAYETSRRKPSFALLSAPFAMIGVAALLTRNQAPQPLLIAIAALTLFLAGAEIRIARLVSVTGAAIVIFGVAMAIISPNRNIDIGATPSFSGRLLRLLEYKLIFRQGVSAACFAHVVETRFDRRRQGNPFYFSTAIVPRGLWPEKPILSRGAEFAVHYCGIPDAKETRYSESITLIGEPVAEAGLSGVLVAELVLVLLLLGASWIGLSGGPVGLIGLAALLPWLADVQQSYAYYIAAVFKSAIIIMPVLALAIWIRRRCGAIPPRRKIAT